MLGALGAANSPPARGFAVTESGVRGLISVVSLSLQATMLRLAAFAALLLFFRVSLELSWAQAIPALFVFYLGSGGWDFFLIFIKTVRRDVT